MGAAGVSNEDDCKVMASQEDRNTWTYVGQRESTKGQPNVPAGGRAAPERLASSRTGENPPYGMNGGGWRNMSLWLRALQPYSTVTPLLRAPPMNRWAIFFRPVGLGQVHAVVAQLVAETQSF